MGLIDTIKQALGIHTGPDPARLVAACVGKVKNLSKDKVAGMAEKEAKRIIADLAADVVNEELDKSNDVPSGFIRDQLVERAIEQVVGKVWDAVKDQTAGAAEG